VTIWLLRERYVEPLPRRLSPAHPRRDEILRRHQGAIEVGDSTYADPTSGFAVFTAQFLADRAYCCLSGCRHCPFESAES
jgi:hypothetical protein